MFAIGRSLSFVAHAFSAIGAGVVIIMMLHITADVAGRYLFNTPLPGTLVVVANYYMIILVFIALGVAEEKRAHISVEVLTDLLPRRAQSTVSVVSGLVTVVVIGIVMIAGYNEAVKKTASVATMEQGSQLIEVWQSYWLIPVGAGFMALVAAYRVIATLTGARSGLQEIDMDAKFIND